MANVVLKHIHKAFDQTVVIPDLDLDIQSGEFMVLVGPSGCGKSTLLRLVAGLEDASGGDILVDGKRVNEVAPRERGVAMVFQNYALYPHMTVKDNMAFALKIAHTPQSEIDTRVGQAAQVLGLQNLLERKPSQLSGGQKQRVAMGRAMVRRPKVFLFDEPLSNLDAQLRVKMRAEIAMLHRREKATVLYVTHDQIEAMTLADRVAVINEGRLEQVGSPLELYHNPETQFVAGFIGSPSMNFLPAEYFKNFKLPFAAHQFGFRPNSTKLTTGASCLGEGEVSLVELLGSSCYVHVNLQGNSVVAETTPELAPKLGDKVSTSADLEQLFGFDSNGKRVRS